MVHSKALNCSWQEDVLKSELWWTKVLKRASHYFSIYILLVPCLYIQPINSYLILDFASLNYSSITLRASLWYELVRHIEFYCENEWIFSIFESLYYTWAYIWVCGLFLSMVCWWGHMICKGLATSLVLSWHKKQVIIWNVVGSIFEVKMLEESHKHFK